MVNVKTYFPYNFKINNILKLKIAFTAAFKPSVFHVPKKIAEIIYVLD